MNAMTAFSRFSRPGVAPLWAPAAFAAVFLSLAIPAVNAPAVAAVYVGTTFNKAIDDYPDNIADLETEFLIKIGDLGMDPTVDSFGSSELQNQVVNLTPAVQDGDFVVNATHLVSYDDSTGAFVAIVSFLTDETVINGAGTIATQDEDLALISFDGSTYTSQVLADFADADLGNNINLDAVYLLTGTADDCLTSAGCTLAVSFNQDVVGRLANGNDMTRDDLTKIRIVNGVPDYSTAATYIDFDFGSSANLDAFTILDNGIALGSFEETHQDPEDGNVLDQDIWAFNGLAGALTTVLDPNGGGYVFTVADVGVRLFIHDVAVDNDTNLESLFTIAVPEPGQLALLGIGLSLIYAGRRRRRLMAAR